MITKNIDELFDEAFNHPSIKSGLLQADSYTHLDVYKRQVYGVIQGVMGYMFLIPYFLIVALVAELCMVGKNTYQSAVRNRICLLYTSRCV